MEIFLATLWVKSLVSLYTHTLPGWECELLPAYQVKLGHNKV